jgi:hypothetical protein
VPKIVVAMARRSVEEQFPEVIARLDELLLDRESGFAASLNAPATGAEIDALRAAIQPYELIAEIEMLYRWHNGQRESRHWWPLFDAGPLLAADEAARRRQQLSDICEEPFQWSEAWLPITQEGWGQVAVKLDEPLQGLVINASFPDEPSVVAESLAAVFQAICRLIETEIPLDSNPAEPPGGPSWMEERNWALSNRRLPVLQWRFPDPA